MNHRTNAQPRPASRAFTTRQYLLAAAVVTVVTAGGLGGYMYYRSNSPSQLSIKAEIALQQHDTTRAIDFLKRALDKNPGGDLAIRLRDQYGRALIEAGREDDARTYLQEALSKKPDDSASLDLMAETYVHSAKRKLAAVPKPFTEVTSSDAVKMLDQEIAGVEKLPPSPRYLVAEAQVHRLVYVILDDQVRQAKSRLNAASAVKDAAAMAKANDRIAALKDYTKRRDKAIELLTEALKQDPKNPRAAQLLVQYESEDRHFARALELYNKFKADKVWTADLAITGAMVLIADTQRQPSEKARLADAQKELESYLNEHPKEPGISRVMVVIGGTMLDQDKIADAAAMADKAIAFAPRDLDAQILQIQSKLRQKKTAEALSLVTPLTNSYGNVPQIWYLLGMANLDNSDLHAAEGAFKKAIQLNPGYPAARHALLGTQVRAAQTDAAVLLATQMVADDPYYIPARKVVVQDLRKHGQFERARNMLLALAADPDLPMESKPDLIDLLLDNGAPEAAQEVLATLPPNDETTKRLRANVLAKAHKFGEAQALMSKEVAAKPQDIDLRLRYAQLLLQARLPADARAQLDFVAAAGSRNPLAPDDWLRVARGYLFLRLPEQAIAATRQALAAQPKSVEAQSLQREAQAMLTGAPATQEAIAVNPDQATSADNIRLAKAAFDRKDYEGTLSIARAGLSRDAGNVPLHHLAARALAALKQYDQAVAEVIAAAQTQKQSPQSFAVFVELFPPEDALKGLGFGSALTSINPALGNWAMGKLAEASGNTSAALKYYRTGISDATKTNDPGTAKDLLFQTVLALDAQKKDVAAIKADADTFARDPNFTVGIRVLASDHLRVLGDSAAAAEQLEKLGDVLAASPATKVILMVCQRWQLLNHPERAMALLEKNLASSKRDPDLLAAYASLLEATDPARALKVREEIVAADPNNPQHKIALAQAQAAAGDEAAAFRTLDETRALGETGRTMATAARLRMLITMGLLHEASGELASDKSAADDFASMLAIGQAWAQLNKPDDARKILAAIPPYANEYAAAVGTIAALDSAAGKYDVAIAALSRQPALAPELFQTYLRAGNPQAALDLAKKQRERFSPSTPPWRTWTVFAATAAREGKDYDEAVSLLTSLDPEAKKAAAFDIALLQLLQNKPEDAVATAASVTEDIPTFNRSTVLLLANSRQPLPTKAALLMTAAPASTVYAYLAQHPHQADLAGIEKNSRVIPGDIDSLLADTQSDPARIQQVALIQRLVEANWTTAALDRLAQLNASGGSQIRLAMVQAHRANTDLRHKAEAEKIRAEVEQVVKSGKTPACPSANILLAAAAAEKEDYNAAIAALEPLVPLNRPDILTTIATFYEKIGKLDQAIALHRQIRSIDPGDVIAANNLAYTLSAAKPNDKAALAEAKAAVQLAIDKAPHVAVFQDTLAWIEIQSGQPADGVKRLARALPQLRLSPAVHYHLGIGYAKLGQTDLARLHLQNVQDLAQSKTPIPELPLATEALKTLAAK
jgi:tetratricopeptide (TPR) repeat protein